MPEFRFPNWSVPIALFLACLISFGLLIPWLGFFWDDWPTIWFLHFLGPHGFVEVFASDRPLLGRLFLLTTSILGESTLSWQIFGFVTRWMSSIALWWGLRILWPSRPQLAAWIALLFAVYPGFGQQFISVTYSHVFIILTIFILSLVTMVLAFRKRRWFWPLYLLSLLCSAFSLFSVEYFFGLEILRPIILWIELSAQFPKQRPRLGRVLLYWLPYLIIMALFLFWRIFLNQTPRGEVQIFDNLGTNPLTELLTLAGTILKDILEVSLLAWAQTLNFLNLKNFGLAATLLYALVVLIAAFIFIVYLLRYRGRGETTSNAEVNPAGAQSSSSRRMSALLILVGIITLFFAGWPFWSTGLPIGLDFPWDRFTLAMMIGTSLIFAGLVLLIARNHWQRALFFGVLTSLAIGLHFQNANHYRREWATQREMFWQLTWRAPGLAPGTMILTSELPFTHFSDNTLTAPLNWTYSPDELPTQMPYLLYQIESRLGKGLDEFEPGLPIEQDYRATAFKGSTDQTLVLYYSPPGCVQVLDQAVHAKIPQKPKYISDAMPLSDLGLINPDANPAARPPEHILGPEPDHNWCYYYEKADLARQTGNWARVVQLAEAAFKLDQRLYPVNAPEFIPYIEGNARTGNWTVAVELTSQSLNLSSRMDRILCITWDRIMNATSTSPERDQALDQVNRLINCPAP